MDLNSGLCTVLWPGDGEHNQRTLANHGWLEISAPKSQ